MILLGEKTTHDISDDLESVFHVLLYYALHYVQHNIKPSPDYKLEELFEQSDLLNDDAGKLKTFGGSGKHLMFTVRKWVKGLNFDSRALQDLFWKLHRLFAGNIFYHLFEEDEQRAIFLDQHQKLQNAAEVIRLFEEALNRPDSEWSEDDKVADQFPRKEQKDESSRLKLFTGSSNRSVRSSSKRPSPISQEGLSDSKPSKKSRPH